MAEARKCPECGSELPPEAPQGLCPQCLLKAGLSSESDMVRDDRAFSTDDTAYSPPPAAVEADSDTMPVGQPGVDPERSIPAGDQPPGTRIRYFGDYELLEEIGRGGMGVVFRARQVTLNRMVALKMILSGQLASEEDVQRFRTEAEAAANLQHANIVSIHEIGEHEGQHYFSMDYVEGQSLAEMVRQRPLPAKRAAEYVKTIAEAIQYAHAHHHLRN